MQGTRKKINKFKKKKSRWWWKDEGSKTMAGVSGEFNYMKQGKNTIYVFKKDRILIKHWTWQNTGESLRPFKLLPVAPKPLQTYFWTGMCALITLKFSVRSACDIHWLSNLNSERRYVDNERRNWRKIIVPKKKRV